MKLLIALTATTLTLFAAAASAGASGRPDPVGRWGGVQPNPRMWVAPAGAVGRWTVKPTPRTWAIGRY